MFPLSHMLKSFVRVGTLRVIDARGRTHVFEGSSDGPLVTMRLGHRSLYRKLFFNPELHAGEAYVDGRLTPASTMTPEDVAVWTEAIPSRQAEAADGPALSAELPALRDIPLPAGPQ